ncbi:MAG: cupin domain-containing protein [Chloroflexi bacterium]|nr:cupin domain-containing protein [Chloroflexota bacterium]
MTNSISPPNSKGNPQQSRGRKRKDFIDVLQHDQANRPITSVDIGQRLREIRSERGISIRELARKSKLNVNTVSAIENGKNSPNVETLQQLAFALGIHIAAFFEDNTPNKKIAYYQLNQRPRIAFAHGVLEDLSAGMSARGIEAFLVMLKPHSNSGDNLMVHTGREVIFCLEGQLTYTIEDQVFLLNPGDSLFFEAHLPHRWQNNGATPTRSLLVICPADEQDRPTEQHFVPPTTSLDET